MCSSDLTTQVQEWDIKKVLRVLESYHKVDYLGDGSAWSEIQLYRCSCATCHRDCVCEHALLMSKIIDKRVKVPEKFDTTRVMERQVRKVGRPAKAPKTTARLRVQTCPRTLVSSFLHYTHVMLLDSTLVQVPGEIGRAHV